MTTVTLNKWGHSYGIRIPQILLKQLQLSPGDQLDLESDLKGQRLILKSATKRKGWLEQFNQKSTGLEDLALPFENEFDQDEWTW